MACSLPVQQYMHNVETTCKLDSSTIKNMQLAVVRYTAPVLLACMVKESKVQASSPSVLKIVLPRRKQSINGTEKNVSLTAFHPRARTLHLLLSSLLVLCRSSLGQCFLLDILVDKCDALSQDSVPVGLLSPPSPLKFPRFGRPFPRLPRSLPRVPLIVPRPPRPPRPPSLSLAPLLR